VDRPSYGSTASGQRWLPERDGAGGYIYVKNLIDLTYVLRVVFRLTTSSWKHVRPLVESWSWLAPPQHTRDVCLAAASHRFSSENPSPWIWIDRDRVRASVPLQLHVSLQAAAPPLLSPSHPKSTRLRLLWCCSLQYSYAHKSTVRRLLAY